jgi:flagellar basal-body rod protein FlgB
MVAGAMELTNLSMFGLMRSRLSWLDQRQEVLARNIANADTPEFQARDLKELDVKTALSKSPGFALQVKLTDPQHLVSQGGNDEFRDAAVRRPFETAPAGNAVVLEEQMGKLNETQVNHSLITELYRKHLQMLETAGRGRAS